MLVAGHTVGAAALDASMVHTLGQIGEALLATGAKWQIRRLASGTGERYAADRATLKRQIDELAQEPVRVAALVVLGAIVELAAGPALVTGEDALAYPDDAALPLAWIGERLRTARAEHVVVVVSSGRAGDAPRWLGALATGRSRDVVAVDAAPVGCPLVDVLLGGLCGDALDPRTGTVTFRSLGELLARRVPTCALQAADTSETVAQAPPLAGFWDVRRSQLAGAPRPRTGERDDLTGAVLPGRFRLDSLVARGTFGTVYRARQLAVERDVAVKVLHADIDPASDDGRLFVDEIRAVGRLDHANVVRIHQADITHDGRLFYAMELLDGKDLQQLGTVPRARAVELVRQLLAGLGAAHDAGLVHADVKPANAIVVAREPERVVLVDFGLARLRALQPTSAADAPAAETALESAGGTPAYMAPEQLQEGRVDARSDLFSAALVLVSLLTGWRRPNAYAVQPPATLDLDPELRVLLDRALHLDPAKRFQSARELAAALDQAARPSGSASRAGSDAHAGAAAQTAPLLPFHHLAPLTERDRGRLHGREADVALLLDHALYRRSVVYTAPSGTGKTSLLRAGLVPRLEALGIHAVYLRCRGDSAERLATAIAPGATALEDALARHAGKLVLLLDQVEAEPELAARVVRDADAAATDVSVVLSVREDHLARLLARIPDQLPIVRLPPLSREGARAAILAPLAQARLAIEPALLDALLADLLRAGAALGAELGWGDEPAVYPPHLQLACSVLYDALPPGEATLTRAHYDKLGGFDAIVGEHLERVVDTELAEGGRDVIARDLFVALVTAAHERAVRPEAELVEVVGAAHGAPRVLEVLELLRARGLLVRLRAEEPSWELVHDSLVPRVLAWIDRKDLARRRAVELVRYHLRRSRPGAPSLLGRAELREVRAHAAAIDELEAQWRDRSGWTPQRLVARSRQVQRRQVATVIGITTVALAIAAVGLYRRHEDEVRAREEQSLRDRDIGRFVLELAPFDWDPAQQRAVAVAATGLPNLRWELRYPDQADPEQPSGATTGARASGPAAIGATRVEHVEARGGRAFLVVDGRGRPGEPCAPSIVPLRQLPGYAHRDAAEPVVRIAVPTCAASRADAIDIPAGPFVFGGPGEPASKMQVDENARDRRIDLPAFAIDRTEVTNAAFATLAAMTDVTGIAPPAYPVAVNLEHAGDPAQPVAGIDWYDARHFCAFMGKRLPSSEEWQKALRGPDAPSNPLPRRNLPWGAPIKPAPAQLGDAGPAPVGSHPLDASPYGVLDLAGNVMEWTSSRVSGSPNVQVARGGAWDLTTTDTLVDYMAIENPRQRLFRVYAIGVRCAR